MSGDHNMNQSDSGWRKRQIALDIKTKNARELGLNYEPSKTIMDMAREAGWDAHHAEFDTRIEAIDRVAKAIRARGQA